MSNDLFERLAELEVPPAPAELDRQVHQRVNRLLLTTHLADLALVGLGYAFLQFTRPLLDLIVLSITGRPLPPDGPPRDTR